MQKEMIYKDDCTETVRPNQKSVADNYREHKLQLDSRVKSASDCKENQSSNVQSQPGPKLYAGGRTKEQILAQRKQMMRPKSSISSQSCQAVQPAAGAQPETPSNPVLLRLAKGDKAKVDKKEMLKLTKKNYEELPEVKLKREQEAKKQQIKDRKEKVKEHERQRRSMIRE